MGGERDERDAPWKSICPSPRRGRGCSQRPQRSPGCVVDPGASPPGMQVDSRRKPKVQGRNPRSPRLDAVAARLARRAEGRREMMVVKRREARSDRARYGDRRKAGGRASPAPINAACGASARPLFRAPPPHAAGRRPGLLPPAGAAGPRRHRPLRGRPDGPAAPVPRRRRPPRRGCPR